MLANDVELERDALLRLREGDLHGAYRVLSILATRRPADDQLRQRIRQIEALIARQSDAQPRMAAEPLRYAHAYIKAGRLEEGLRFLHQALNQDPSNDRVRDLARQVSERIQIRSKRTKSVISKNGGQRERDGRSQADPVDVLKGLLNHVRQRRRSPSQWLVEP